MTKPPLAFTDAEVRLLCGLARCCPPRRRATLLQQIATRLRMAKP
jgi:hypothetical protein